MVLQQSRNRNGILFGVSDKPSNVGARFWAQSLEEIDREVARLATLCGVRLLDPGVIERVLHNDDSVCGTKNRAAFDKLRNVLTMHYHAREKAVGVLGEAVTKEVIAEIVANLRKRLGDRLGGSPSA